MTSPATTPSTPLTGIAAIIQAAIDAALANGTAQLDEARVIELIGQHAATPTAAVQTVIIETVRNGAPLARIEASHPELERIIRKVGARKHVFIAGPAGSGKTWVGEQAAKACGLPFYMSGSITSRYSLLGYKDGSGTYQTTAFRQAVEHGGLFLLDEIDGSDAAELLAINAHLAARAGQTVAFPDGMVSVHPDYVYIASANTYGHGADRVYVGRAQLDGSTLDRFYRLAFGYDEALEARLAGDTDQARAWVRCVQAIRAEARVMGAKVIVSMRASIEGASDLADGDTVEQVEDARIFAGHNEIIVARLRAAADNAVPVRALAA